MKRLLSLLALGALLVAPADAQYFGSTVAVSGDLAIAGGRGNDISPGALYIYDKQDDGTWAEVGTLQATDGREDGDGFGSDVSISGDWMAVGAPGTSSVYFFERGEDGVWTEAGRLQNEEVENFGGNVEMDGNHLLVTVSGGWRSQGSVYAYEWTDDGWAARGMLEPPTPEPADTDASVGLASERGR